jgi:hypothetical protein
MRRFSTILLSMASAATLASPAAAQQSPAARTATTSCAPLSTLLLPDVRITEAAAVAAGDRLTVPHCKVSGVIGREIRFELLLPDAWNQRFVMGGGGGFVGAIDNQAVGSVNAGYATVATDTGHAAPFHDASWALGEFERQVNFGHLAVHRTAVVARAIIRTYYESAPRYSYFVGCSNGGRQGLMEAQRYPEDFDGIVAGAPALNFTHIVASFARNAQTLFPNPESPTVGAITQENLALLGAKVLEACDAGDAVRDGIIDDPRTCAFKVSSLPACVADRPGPQCVTVAQRAAIARIYEPVLVSGQMVYPGQPVGGEGERAGWQGWITGPIDMTARVATRPPALQWAFGTQFFKYFVFADPAWDYTRYDFSTWARDTKQVATFLNSDNPDLSGFARRRGKLLIWHGWSDAALNALETIGYYDAVLKRDAAMRDTARLFLLPGVQHCAGGAGPDSVDWLATLSDWVEHGKAPERVIASKRDKGTTLRTRPLCAYPQRAVYRGAGSTDDAAQFVCRNQ